MLENLQQNVQRFVSENATVLLTGGGVVGTVATGALAWRGGFKAGRLDHAEENVRLDHAKNHPDMDPMPEPRFLEKVQLYGIHAIPPVVTGGLTITAVIFAHRMSAQKAAAMAALYGLSQDRFEEYRNKVEEKLTGNKAQQIDDEVAQDRVNQDPNNNTLVVIEGKVLCYDDATGRYFRGTMEEIRSAENEANRKIYAEDYLSATEFYDMLGLPGNVWSDSVGWNMDNPIALKISTTLTDGTNEPCLHMSFKNMPRPDYHPRGYGP